MYLIFLLFVLNLLILFLDIINFCSWKVVSHLALFRVYPFHLHWSYNLCNSASLFWFNNFEQSSWSNVSLPGWSFAFLSKTFPVPTDIHFPIQIFRRCMLMWVFDPILFFAYIAFNLGRWNFHHHVFEYGRLYSCQPDRFNYFSGTNKTAYCIQPTHPKSPLALKLTKNWWIKINY